MIATARKIRWLKCLGLALALLNLTLWFGVVWLRNGFDALNGRLDDPERPYVSFGVQELLLYFDPWLAQGLFPVAYTLGLAAVALLFESFSSTNRPSGSASRIVLTVVLVVLEGVWLSLIAITILCRGPNWNFHWPWEDWDPHRIVPLNQINLSDHFWHHWMRQPSEGIPWYLREAPGLVFLTGYFLLGLFTALSLARRMDYIITYCWFVFLLTLVLALAFPLEAWVPVAGLFLAAGYLTHRLSGPLPGQHSTGDGLPIWRSCLLVFLIQVAGLVPVKMLMYWTFKWKYWLFLPELDLNL